MDFQVDMHNCTLNFNRKYLNLLNCIGIEDVQNDRLKNDIIFASECESTFVEPY